MILLASTLDYRTRETGLWRAFYSHNNLSKFVVLDPFMGGGTSLVEAVKMGARVIGVDIDPVAWFVTKKELEPCNLDWLTREASHVVEDVRTLLSGYYATYCPLGHHADVVYFFWVDVASCQGCGAAFDAHPHYVLA